MMRSNWDCSVALLTVREQFIFWHSSPLRVELFVNPQEAHNPQLDADFDRQAASQTGSKDDTSQYLPKYVSPVPAFQGCTLLGGKNAAVYRQTRTLTQQPQKQHNQ